MPRDEQRERMRRMRAVVAANDAHAWASRMLADVLKTCRKTQAPVVHSPSATDSLCPITV
jgi:trehalose-6-phosphate synthase